MEDNIKEVMEEVNKLWDFAAARCAPSLQARQRDAIESKLRELLQDKCCNGGHQWDTVGIVTPSRKV